MTGCFPSICLLYIYNVCTYVSMLTHLSFMEDITKCIVLKIPEQVYLSMSAFVITLSKHKSRFCDPTTSSYTLAQS